MLRSLLFNLYVNDKNEGNKCTILQYADDTVLLSVNQNKEEAITYLQQSIARLVDYFNFHSLALNADKTEFIVFGDKRGEHTLLVNDEVISEVDEVKYLGVFIDKKLSYQTQLRHVLSKMAQGIKIICLEEYCNNPLYYMLR